MSNAAASVAAVVSAAVAAVVAASNAAAKPCIQPTEIYRKRTAPLKKLKRFRASV